MIWDTVRKCPKDKIPVYIRFAHLIELHALFYKKVAQKEVYTNFQNSKKVLCNV